MREVWKVCGRRAGGMLGVCAPLLTLTPGGAFRFHWPMHGPHAFASTTPPASSKIAVNPSASIAFATATEPGVT